MVRPADAQPGSQPNQVPIGAPNEAPNEAPTIAVSMGDPGGVGPEVLVKALSDSARRARARFRVLGVGSAMQAAAQRAGIEPFWWRVPYDSTLTASTEGQRVVLHDYETGEIGTWPATAGKRGGLASYLFVEEAIRLAKLDAKDPLHAHGIVTAPISKEAWAMAGKGRYPGHTELLADRFGAKRSAMMFVSPKLRVVLATCHIPLMQIRDTLTVGRVFDAIDLAADACAALGLDEPRLAICGLNPHAGERGLLGDEEERLIEPAIELAVRHGIDASGPHPADTVFHAARRGRYDLVVAMYHDQGLLPVKLLDWDSAVNVTLGLGAVRTSPDHGTAFDIAGTNRADPGSMGAAIDLAIDLASTPA